MLSQNRSSIPESQAGFTLAEALIVIVVIGLLAAIAAPAWFGFLDRQKLNAAQSATYRAFQAARSEAMRTKEAWQVSLREQDVAGQVRVQLATHPAKADPSDITWSNFELGVRLDSESTLPQRNVSPLGEHRYVIFNHTGCPATVDSHECRGVPPGRITFSSKHQDEITDHRRVRRCVIVSTILGAMRMSHQQRQPVDGKYCY